MSDAQREQRITDRQLAICRYRDACLGWRMGTRPTTRVAYGLCAAWWRLESLRDHDIPSRDHTAAYASNMRWAAERVGDRSMAFAELHAEAADERLAARRTTNPAAPSGTEDP